MTLYWRLAGRIYRLVPKAWLRKWAHDYLRESGGVVAYPGAHHFTIMATRRIRLETGAQDGAKETFEMTPGDTMQVFIAGRHAGLNVYPVPSTVGPDRRFH